MFIDYSDPNNVIIQHNEHRFQGKFIKESRTWLHIAEESNFYIYEVIGINDIKSIYKFISSIVGYEVCDNSVYNVSDLVKVLNAINKEYDRQFGSEEYINIENCKNGDYLCVENGKFKAIYIFRERRGDIVYRHAFYRCDCKYLDTDEGYLSIKSTTKIRKATSDEAQTLNNALLVKKGLFWNSITKQLEKVESSISVGVLDTISAGVPAITYTACNRKLVYKALEVENIIERPSTPSETVPDISIKTFIKPKKHYKLNFNN